MATTHGIALSARTAARLACDLKDENNLGEREAQYQKIASYFAAVRAADPQATTDINVTTEHEFIGCFISWGFARTAIAIVKPVVAIDGAHLSPDGTGTVCILFCHVSHNLNVVMLSPPMAGSAHGSNRRRQQACSACSRHREDRNIGFLGILPQLSQAAHATVV
jgi:hypothetical protein